MAIYIYVPNSYATSCSFFILHYTDTDFFFPIDSIDLGEILKKKRPRFLKDLSIFYIFFCTAVNEAYQGEDSRPRSDEEMEEGDILNSIEDFADYGSGKNFLSVN
jgi:hypothetical protein